MRSASSRRARRSPRRRSPSSRGARPRRPRRGRRPRRRVARAKPSPQTVAAVHEREGGVAGPRAGSREVAEELAPERAFEASYTTWPTSVAPSSAPKLANAVSWLPASVAGSTTRRFAFSTTNWPAEGWTRRAATTGARGEARRGSKVSSRGKSDEDRARRRRVVVSPLSAVAGSEAEAAQTFVRPEETDAHGTSLGSVPRFFAPDERSERACRARECHHTSKKRDRHTTRIGAAREDARTNAGTRRVRRVSSFSRRVARLSSLRVARLFSPSRRSSLSLRVASSLLSASRLFPSLLLSLRR